MVLSLLYVGWCLLCVGGRACYAYGWIFAMCGRSCLLCVGSCHACACGPAMLASAVLLCSYLQLAMLVSAACYACISGLAMLAVFVSYHAPYFMRIFINRFLIPMFQELLICGSYAGCGSGYLTASLGDGDS